MDPITLSVAGYSLFLSSFITLVVLMRRNINQWLKSPFCILSISDILSSIFTAIILLINYTNIISDPDSQNQDNIINVTNPWSIKMGNNTLYNVAFNSFLSNQSTIIGNNLNATLPCEVGNIIMYYAMILIPLTNSLISLVSFCAQCNLNALYLKNKCAELCHLQITRDKHRSKKSNKELTSSQKVSNLQIMTLTAKSSNKGLSVEYDNNFDTGSELASDALHKNNRKFVGVFIISQWIIPIIVTGLLYFAEYKNIYDIKHTDNIQCLFENDFLNKNCYNINKNISSIKSTHSGIIFMQSNDNYVTMENLTTMPNMYNKQTDEIILKIKNIVSSAFYDSFGISSDAESEGSSKSNIPSSTNYMHFNIQATTYKSSNVTMITDSNTMEETSEIINKISHTSFVPTEDKPDVHTALSNTNAENSSDQYNVEQTLFQELLKKSWLQTNSTEKDSYNNPIVVDSLTNFETKQAEYTTAPTASQQQYTISMSNNEIYANMIKRIQSVRAKNGLRYSQKSDQYNKKQTKQNIIQDTNLLNNSFLIQGLCPLNKDCVITDIDKEINSITCARGNCFLSPTFFKLHLLIFTFLIYFTCALLSITLQMKGRSMCKISLSNISAKVSILSTTLMGSNVNELEHVRNDNITIDGHESCGHSKWFPKYKEENVPTNNEADNKDKDHDHNYMDLLTEVQNILKLFHILKRSFLIGMLLWTPMLFQLLLKAFMCINAPSWLTNITFLCAMLFGTIRNILNFYMIKINKANKSVVKGNSVLPSA